MGIFDGTVKEHASEWVHTHILPIFKQNASFLAFDALVKEEKAKPEQWRLLEKALYEVFLETDRQLLVWCAQKQYDYTSCTGVVCLIYIPARVMLCAHVGDSHAVLGIRTEKPNQPEDKWNRDVNSLFGEFLTVGHKADTPAELQRIQEAGGSLVYLHGGKAFIRGGDFKNRKHAMQLNYSRAFGGKDLKMYGLSCVPDIKRVLLRRQPASQGAAQFDVVPVMVILGSDGLWDVVDPSTAVRMAQQLHAQHLAAAAQGQRTQTPGSALIKLALQTHIERGSNDNVTNIICMFNFDGKAIPR